MNFRSIRFALAMLAALAASMAGAIPTAWAHEMPKSAVLLDIHDNGVMVELHLPILEFEVGFGKPLQADPQGNLTRYHSELLGYIGQHISAVAPDGRPWKTEVRDIEMGNDETPPLWQHPVKFYRAHVWMTPPPGASVRKFTFNYDPIVHQLITHIALLSIRRDWNTATFDGNPYVLGEVRFFRKSFAVDMTNGTPMRGFLSVVRLGMRHIAEGTDHLLFLLVLLLPASLNARNGRWAGPAGVKESIWRLLKVASAFTLGHSLTLIAGAVGWVRPPEQPIEVLIAVSIFVSAVHALKPLFPGREAYVAAGFGLIHGLSFATVVAGFGLDAWHMTLSIFGFNIGIELMQLFVIGVTVPWLLLLTRTGVYPFLRIGGAIGSGIAAIAWMLERALGWANPVGDLVEKAAKHAGWIAVGLAVVAVGATVVERVRVARLTRQNGPETDQ